MSRAARFAVAFIFAVCLLLIAEAREYGTTVYFVTSFDFTAHPVCGPSSMPNCIKAIRFYNADSRLPLAEVETKNMTGQQSIVGTAKVGSIPRRVYAVTVYVDSRGSATEGPRGPISEFNDHASH